MTSTSPSFHPRDDPIQRRLAQARRKRQRSLSWLVWLSLAVFMVGMTVSLVLVRRGTGRQTAVRRRTAEGRKSPSAPSAAAAMEQPRAARRPVAATPPPASALVDDAVFPPWDSPTSGAPVDLHYLPAGAHLIVAYRPAAVLASPTGQEVLEGLGPAAQGLLESLETFCGVPPSSIAHALIGYIPSSDGRPPRAAAVVRLGKPIARSTLLNLWGNPAPATEGIQRYYVAADAQRAFYIVGEKTFTVAPPELLREVLADSGREQPLPRYPEAMIPHSDADRHLSLVFDTEFLRDDARHLFPADAMPSVNAALAFLGDDVPGGILSVHLAPELFAELVVYSPSHTSPYQLSAALDERLQQLPYEVLELVRRLRPRRGVRLIGRFPAMLKALAVCTSRELSGRVARLRVLLPERAGPNLAWAAPLVVGEANRSATDRATGASAARAHPLSLRERLARPITIGFRRTALREAVGMIAEEAGFEVEFQMKDLEAIGVTGNIPQEGEYRDVPPAEILDAILNKLQLVYIIEREENKLYITSRNAAIERGQIPADES